MNLKVLLLSAASLCLLMVACKTTPVTSSGSSSSTLPGASGGASGSASPSSQAPSGSSESASGGAFPMPSAGSGTLPPSAGEAASSGQSVDELDDQLDKSLEDFDGRVAGAGADSGEIDILDPTGRNTGGVAASVPVFEEADVGAGDVENPDIEARASEGFEGDSEGDVASAESGVAGAETLPVPDDIGDGRGDDIVLRQIREAAMREPDPELREKLWDEYRRIKGQ